LNLLKLVNLSIWKTVIQRITVVKFRKNNVGGNGTGSFEIQVWMDTAEFTNTVVARFIGRKCRDVIRESEMFIKNKANSARE